jgi:hypothetical protein
MPLLKNSKNWIKKFGLKAEIQSFWKNVRKTRTCWIWTGKTNHHGYGLARYMGKYQRAHRVSWQLKNGKIKAKILLLHECDNPPCIRLGRKHVIVGTQKKNIQDCIKRGRFRWKPVADKFKCRGEKHHWTKLTDKQVRYIRDHYRRGQPHYGGNVKQLAKRFKVIIGTIRNIANNKTRRGK